MLQFTDFWDIFGSFFGTFGLFAVIIPIFFFIFVIIIIAIVCRTFSGASQAISRGFTIEAPSFVIPEEHRDRTRQDGSQMTTVRLPDRCPSCGANITHEGIDWTGPLQARCTYCGGTVRASFERV